MQTKTAKRGNRLLCLLLAVLMVCSLLPMSALAADGDDAAKWDGSTTKTPALVDGVYQIGTAEELAWFGQKTYEYGGETISGKLTADIDLNGQNWLNFMIGEHNEWSEVYSGSFDGDGHTISGFYLEAQATPESRFEDDEFGLFAKAQKATIKNFTLNGEVKIDYSKATVASNAYDIGGVIGRAEGVTLSGITSNVKMSVVNDTNNYASGIMGGIAGALMPHSQSVSDGSPIITESVIENCVNNGEISGSRNVGGIAGYMASQTTARNCVNNGKISSTYSTAYVGGIGGRVEGGTVESSYNAGAVYSSYNAGGIAGSAVAAKSTNASNPGEWPATVQNCYNIGAVSSSANSNAIGGIVGYGTGYLSDDFYSILKNCYNVGAVSTEDTGTSVKLGAICGDALYVTVENQFYLEGTAAKGLGDAFHADSTAAVSKTADELKADDVLTALGEGFKKDAGNVNGGYPVLSWQQSDAPEEPKWDGEEMTWPAQDENGVYLIGTAEELAWFGDETRLDMTICGKLTADIDLNGKNWNNFMFAESSYYGAGYHGTFDGDGHTIKGFKLEIAPVGGKIATYGLIQYADRATVKNLTMEGEIVVDYTNTSSEARTCYVGSVAGYAKGCTFSGITSNVNITVVNDTNTYATGYFGGIVGGISFKSIKNDDSTVTITPTLIENCANNGNITGGTEVGGITARSGNDTTITGCHNTGAVTAAGDMIGDSGGIVGFTTGIVEKCYNTGAVIGTSNAGGIAGYAGYNVSTNAENPGKWASEVRNCYNTGDIYSKGLLTYSKGAGGIVGDVHGSSGDDLYVVLKNCYNTGKVSAASDAKEMYAGSVSGYVWAATIENQFYLAGTAEDGVGFVFLADSSAAVSKTADELKSDEVLTALGNAFAKDTDNVNGGYPVLRGDDEIPCDHVDEDGDRLCDKCGANLNNVPVLIEGVTDQTVIIQTGQSYQLDDLMDGKIFTDPDGDSLNYTNYFYRKSSDGGETWGELTGFKMMEFGGIDKSLANSVAGVYTYEFVAYDGYGYSEQKWTLTLDVRDVVPANVNFYVGRDQNYDTHQKYPVLELYKTAGIDENQFDYVGWFTNAEGKTEYVYNPADYAIIDGDEKDYVVIDDTRYELHDYEKVSFTNSAFDASVSDATPSGTVVNNYNMFYATIETGRYSTRAYGWNAETNVYDVYLGGQSLPLPMEKDIYGGGGSDIHLGVVSCYVSSQKADGTYFTADDHHIEMIMPVTGSMIHSGDPYAYVRYSTTYTAFPFFSYMAGNASLYNAYAYPKDTEHYMFSQKINQLANATYNVVTNNLTIAEAIQVNITVPEDAEFDLYFQYNNFNTKRVEPLSDPASNEDGTKTISYRVSKSNGNYTWRLTDPTGKYVTKAGWLAGVSAETDKTITFGDDAAVDKKTHDLSGLGTTVASRDEADLQVYLSHSGFMSTQDTFRVRAFRMWELIDSDTANIMLEPDFNVQMLQGNEDDVKQVDGGNAEGNWIDVKPTGTDIVAVTYDAIDVYSNRDAHSTHGGLFPANAPERTGVFVVTNEASGSADAHIAFNGGTESSRGADWDYNYDTWFYMDTDTAPTLDFTVTSTGDTQVSYAVVTTDAAMKSTLSDWTALTPDSDGSYHADLLKFRDAGTLGGTVIIKMTDSTGTSYRLARAAQMKVTITNASHTGEAIQPGDNVRISFDGLYRGVDKVSGIFNPTTLYLNYYAGETKHQGTLGQYQQMDRTTVTVTVPADLEFPEGESSIDYTVNNGFISGSMYSASSPFDTMYNMTDTGVGTNFSAVGISFNNSRLADVTFKVEPKVYYNVELDVSDEDGAITDANVVLTSGGTAVTAEEDGTYKLGYGSYSFKVTKPGYVCYADSFKLGSADAADVVDGVITKSVVLTKAAENAWDGTTLTEPAKDENGVYQIGTGAELAWFGNTVNSGSASISGVLTADIDLAAYEWTSIGLNSSGKKFAGSFDGQNHRIYNLAIDYKGTTTAIPYKGLFGYVSGSSSAYAEIKNFTVQGNVVLTSNKNVSGAYSGGVIGRADYTNITNVHNEVNVTVNRVGGNWDSLGGIVGYTSNVNIKNCSNSGTINGWRYIAGIAGNISNTTIYGCVNTGVVKAPSTCAAGIVANVGGSCKVSACYNTGAITAGGNYAAGIAGYVGNAEVSNCFNTGVITCNPSFAYGSVIGTVTNASAVIKNMYYLEGTCEKGGIGSVKDEATQTAAAVSAETLASAEFVDMVNAELEEPAFVKSAEHPVLAWEVPETPVLKGDANGDGIIDATDAVLVLRYYADSTTEGINITAADVNGDGIVDANDAVAILKLYAANQE